MVVKLSGSPSGSDAATGIVAVMSSATLTDCSPAVGARFMLTTWILTTARSDTNIPSPTAKSNWSHPAWFSFGRYVTLGGVPVNTPFVGRFPIA